MGPGEGGKCEECIVKESKSTIIVKEASNPNGRPETLVQQRSTSSGTMTAVDKNGVLVQNLNDITYVNSTTTTVKMDETGNITGATVKVSYKAISPDGEVLKTESSSLSGTFEDGKIKLKNGKIVKMDPNII